MSTPSCPVASSADEATDAEPPSPSACPQVDSLTLGGESLIVISLPTASPGCVRLTPVERIIVDLVMQGLSNAEIARCRGASPRTIANQLAAIYRKLGVNSRAELAAVLEEQL